MSFSGYGIVLYDPRTNPADWNEIPAYYSPEYFIEKFLEKWEDASIKYIPEYPVFSWTIPNLDSFENDNLFMGDFHYDDKGITFDQTPPKTIIMFLLWIRSIVLEDDKVYFVKISEFEVLEIYPNTTAEDIDSFLNFNF